MKKKIHTLVGGLALAAIVGVNCYMAIDGSTTSSELDVTNVERLAEGWEWSDLLGSDGKGWEFYFSLVEMKEHSYQNKPEFQYNCVRGNWVYNPFVECHLGEYYIIRPEIKCNDGQYYCVHRN